MSNPLARAITTYKTIVPNPLVHAGVVGLGTWYASKKAIPTIQDMLINATMALTGKSQDPKAIQLMRHKFKQQMDTPLAQYTWTQKVPKVLGILSAVTTIAGSMDFLKKNLGLLLWSGLSKNAMEKKASLWLSVGYQPLFKFNQKIESQAVLDIFKTNPILRDDAYAKNFGMSIVNAAPSIGYGNITTLGSIYDSAYNKFLNKLTFQGVAKLGLKSMIAGSMAGLFTDTLGTVMGLPDATRQTMTKSVALGTTLYNILT